MDDRMAWAQGTHEYRPMGVAVIAASDLFSLRAFVNRRPAPSRDEPTFVGLFASIGDLNAYLADRRSQPAKKNSHRRPSYSPPYI
jgi:hypothetical protein